MALKSVIEALAPEFEGATTHTITLVFGADDVIAFLYGPIVLAGRFGQQGLAPHDQIIVNERESGSMLTADVAIPVLAGDGPALAKRIRQDPHRALTFRNRWCRATARRGTGALLPARTPTVQRVLEGRAGLREVRPSVISPRSR